MHLLLLPSLSIGERRGARNGLPNAPTRVPQTLVLSLSIRNQTDEGLALDFRRIWPTWPIPKLGGDDIISGDFRPALQSFLR